MIDDPAAMALCKRLSNDEPEGITEVPLAVAYRAMFSYAEKHPQRAALKLAITHIEHMAKWIGDRRSGYSFESLGEDLPGIRAALDTI